MSVLKEEYSLPNSNWLQKLLKCEAEITKGCIDVEQKAVDTHPGYTQDCKTYIQDLEILNQVIKQCIKSGKYVTLTEIQWHRICGILDMIGINSFDSTYWNTNRTDTSPRLRNLHSLNKYRDLYSFEISTCSYSRLGIPSYEQWIQCVEGVCDCSIRSLPNSRWLRNILEYEIARCIGDDGHKTSSEILHRCVGIGEGKPICLTEEQWHWLYGYILLIHRSDLWYDYIASLGLSESKEENDCCETLNKYTELFKEDIDSFFKKLSTEEKTLVDLINGKSSMVNHIDLIYRAIDKFDDKTHNCIYTHEEYLYLYDIIEQAGNQLVEMGVNFKDYQPIKTCISCSRPLEWYKFYVDESVKITIEPESRNTLVEHAMKWIDLWESEIRKYDKKDRTNYYTDYDLDRLNRFELITTQVFYDLKLLNMIVENRGILLLNYKHANHLHVMLTENISMIWEESGVDSVSSGNVDPFLKAFGSSIEEIEGKRRIVDNIVRQILNSVSDSCQECTTFNKG
jgi:hypothetical protein